MMLSLLVLSAGASPNDVWVLSLWRCDGAAAVRKAFAVYNGVDALC